MVALGDIEQKLSEIDAEITAAKEVERNKVKACASELFKHNQTFDYGCTLAYNVTEDNVLMVLITDKHGNMVKIPAKSFRQLVDYANTELGGSKGWNE
jgi:hypothetical protein